MTVRNALSDEVVLYVNACKRRFFPRLSQSPVYSPSG